MERSHARGSLFRLPVIVIGLLVGLASSALAEGPSVVKQHKPCSNAILSGSYGYYKTGKILEDGGTLVGVGIATFDGNGKSYGTESDNRNGELDLDQWGSGRYQVYPDCSGALLRDDGEEYSRLVVVNDGNGLYLFSETNAVYVVATKLHTDRPGATFGARGRNQVEKETK